MSENYIIIGGDLVATPSNQALFCDGNAEELVGEDILAVLNKAGYRIFNLEVPLTDEKRPISKNGQNLIAPYKTVNGYKALRADLLTLANNHILDQDVQGLHSTRKALDEAGIAYLGAGDTPAEASAPYTFEWQGKEIGVYACAEHEFTLVSDDRPGANPYDPLESFDHVQKLKAECDFVIVLYHGGKEHYRYPSPNLQKICRKFIEKGADLVICQHSHCIGCEEKYQGSTIVYGQGNFLFDSQDNEFWQTSLLVSINDSFEIEYIPLKKAGKTVRAAKGTDKEEILSSFRERSAEILNPEAITEHYKEVAALYIEGYLKLCFGDKCFVFQVFNKLARMIFGKSIIDMHYNGSKILAIRNIIECEAHNELFIRGLKGRL